MKILYANKPKMKVELSNMYISMKETLKKLVSLINSTLEWAEKA